MKNDFILWYLSQENPAAAFSKLKPATGFVQPNHKLL